MLSLEFYSIQRSRQLHRVLNCCSSGNGVFRVCFQLASQQNVMCPHHWAPLLDFVIVKPKYCKEQKNNLKLIKMEKLLGAVVMSI